MKYIIQTRKLNNLRKAFSYDAMTGIDHENWVNQDGYHTQSDAEENATSLIKHGQYKATDVRIVKVVSTFKSTVNVEVEVDG